MIQPEHTQQTVPDLPQRAGDLPLVSVIIRSMDRPTLSNALDSVALQTYPNIEVVLVNAKGHSHRELGDCCGRFPLRMVGQDGPLGRSQSANVGLDNTRGECLIFLDDDDWFEPHHITSLRAGFGDDETIAAVYAAVRCVNDRGEETRRFEEGFDWTQLRIDNYIPIHSVLFRRRVIDAGVRFDEALNVCEDWDFWLQVAEQGSFHFIPEVGATYRIDSQLGSGVWDNPESTRRTMMAIYRKWLPRWTDETLWSVLEYARYKRMLNQADRLLRAAGIPGASFSDLIANGAKLQTNYQAEAARNIVLQQQIDTIYASKSWRFTAPLRLASAMLKQAIPAGQRLLQKQGVK